MSMCVIIIMTTIITYFHHHYHRHHHCLHPQSQFTTFENLSLDVLLLGDEAKQGFAVDTWSLGLCLLHLCTGEAPYEEVCV